LFRKWLGDEVGWWGADDLDFAGHTYGGDNYLSARIWELGYTVDIVEAARVKDNVIHDDLRDANYAREKQAPGRYHKRFPQGPAINSSLNIFGQPQPNACGCSIFQFTSQATRRSKATNAGCGWHCKRSRWFMRLIT